ncbi:cyclopropane-fatty-acyl-phospholipid synthase family protein [Martelella sp. AD-3]|uniref:SAM-dependent methyltransferase n=1 Tax=Martelella sp. AD-3 TaxID=686597 RepID=UPI000465822E|nr:cyclopropane-fatty-acyl-phospholipid synthase family protein [Martelella sp. AD-3]AMM83293.1 cyclopropane-fatty-acyl-phospholipid synthase [Martelella sp. AD-3]MAM11340.1 class I SAM-dependent methyltransferase [Rhizobiaceae bacterium]
MASPLFNLIDKIIKTGTLRIKTETGEITTFGDGSGEPVAVRFTDRQAQDLVASDPALTLGEMYMQGRFLMEEGDIYDFLSLVRRNTLDIVFSPMMAAKLFWRTGLAQISTRLPINRNRKNVSHHYDLTPPLFSLFLDEDWQYSCAYFDPPDISLDEAQLAKKRHIAAKLRLNEGQRVLEIGSGWGGLSMYLAEMAGVDCTGITLSHEQHDISEDRAAKRGLSDRVRFKLQDYRTMKAKPFDRIVSVGMFEHVGIGRYRNFFDKCFELLDDDGVMVLHSIGRDIAGHGHTNPFIEKYIFPGGYIPSLAEVLPAVEKSGLLVRDIEILQMHYAHTLRAWRQRFVSRKEEAIRLYDEQFFRMWEFYLAGSEMAFEWDKMFVFQMQLSKSQFATPNNRRYMFEAEEKLKAAEATRAPLEPVEFD